MQKKHKKLKRLICFLLVAALAAVELPMNAFAKTDNILYGDVNADGKVDLNDVLILKRYIAEENPSAFNFTNADVNADNEADMIDLLMLKKYLAEWEIELGPELITVNFYDGNRLIDTLTAVKGSPLGHVPEVSKSSKENAILEGYYTDRNFTEPFYAENPVETSMNVYAKYADMGSTEQLNLTSFAQMDQSADLSFEIICKSGNILPADAAELIVKDGSDPVSISITDEDADGIYIVNAPEGFNEGCSYELTLADGWYFKDKEETIRTASFSIAMEEVENLQMNDSIIYIEDTDYISYNVGGENYDVLTSDDVDETGGTFVYDYASELKQEDIICIYTGIKPTERDSKNGSELLDPAVYVKVSEVNGNTVTFAPLAPEDQAELYNVPDNFPIKVSELPTTETGSVNINLLDCDMYATMMDDEGTYENALEKIAVGDFVTLFISEDSIQSESNLYFGQITEYNEQTGEITYKQVEKQDILDSMDLYSDLNVAGSDMITEDEEQYIETVLYEQVNESNFASEAAAYLCDMVTKTDGFRNNMTVKDYLLSDENGNPLSTTQIKALNLGGSFELADDIQLDVELITNGEQLHFDGGVQLAIKVDASFEVEVEDGAKVAIDLTATFVEEVQIDPSVHGKIVTKEILFIPIPIGVSVNSCVDIRNFTAFSFAAEIYTVAAEDKNIWEKIKDIAKDPTEVLGLPGIPEKYKDGMKTIGDVMDKIEEVKGKIEKAEETVDKIEGYKKDLDELWSFVEDNGITNQEEWEQMGEKLGKTSVAQDLLELMDMTTDTEISAEYLEDMQALMDKYSETVQKETDWVELVNEEMFFAEVCFCGFVIGVSSDFIVRADMSIAIGSNLEYEVGKRYNFWFKIGLFKPSAGSTTMDLMDEHFAFQFYVMGRIGIKAGVRAKIYFGIGSGKFASVGIAAELGPYIKIYGFFVYEYTKYRPANTQDWISKERMAGALYLDFGLYFMMGFEANALGDLFEYSYDFLDLEIPLLTAGDSRYYYSNAYKPEEDEKVIVRDEDGNSATGITMLLPDSTLALSYLDLDSGVQGIQRLDYSKYIFSVSNPNFKIDNDTGKISVTVPDNTRYMECDLTITYRYGKMAFSQYDMSVTVPLVWTNLSTEELSEYYTASVRVGNDRDGYQTVWQKRVLKNQEFDLPTDDEIKEIIGWNDAKYIQSAGYNNQPVTGLTLLEDTVYDYTVDYKTYDITVDGIQGNDGSTTSKTYTAKYGEAFDFSDLNETGTASDGIYTKFAGLGTTATIVVNGKDEIIDLTQKINNKLAEALLNGVHATAEYVDDSVTATFTFTGINHADITQKLKKGTTPSLGEIEEIVSDNGLAIKDISPEIGKVNAATLYQVICGEISGPAANISFEENGGSDVPDITKVEGSLIGTLPTPVRTGYSFGGWYTDDGTFQNEFTERKMPVGGAKLYAKWTANEYTVTFNVNGGNDLAENDKTRAVVFDGTYGTLPQPTKSGYGFAGWFTQAEGGTEITADTIVTDAKNQILYAHWKQLKEIPANVFDFGEAEIGTYSKGQVHEVLYSFDAGSESILESEFTFKYMRQGNSEYEEGLPVNAGTYNVTISRPGDNEYAKFEHTYIGVITIDKATWPEEAFVNADIWNEMSESGLNSIKVQLDPASVDDLSENAQIIYTVAMNSGELVIPSEGGESEPVLVTEKGYITNLIPDTEYAVTFRIVNDPNYYDVEYTKYVPTTVRTQAAPTDSWADYTEEFTADEDSKTISISTAGQLAYLAKMVNEGKNYAGYTVNLEADVDLRAHKWVPIGNIYMTSSFELYNNSFNGIFDGKGHTVSGLYTTGYSYSGLFGYVLSGEIYNLTLTDSYVGGNYRTAGVIALIMNGLVQNCINNATIIGESSSEDYGGTAGIAGYAMDGSKINQCVNNGRVDGKCNIGGVVGTLYGSSNVTNSLNYGPVKGTLYHCGGIAGRVFDGYVTNCANFGSVSCVSAVGGIAGQNEEDGWLLNCYTVGTVKGTDKYVGAVVGRNYKDKGAVHQVYYLAGSATCNGALRNAAGTEKGSLGDGESKKNLSAASFTSPTSGLSRNADCGDSDLTTALNNWVEWWNDTQCSAKWESDGNEYPLPIGAINTNKGTKQ